LFTAAAAAAAAANALSYCIAVLHCSAVQCSSCSAMQCKSPHDFGIDLV